MIQELALRAWVAFQMLEAKTKGNVSKEEERMLATTLSSLRLTFVEEALNRHHNA